MTLNAITWVNMACSFSFARSSNFSFQTIARKVHSSLTLFSMHCPMLPGVHLYALNFLFQTHRAFIAKKAPAIRASWTLMFKRKLSLRKTIIWVICSYLSMSSRYICLLFQVIYLSMAAILLFLNCSHLICFVKSSSLLFFWTYSCTFFRIFKLIELFLQRTDFLKSKSTDF